MKLSERTTQFLGKCSDVVESIGSTIPALHPIAAIIFWAFVVDVVIYSQSL